MIFIGKMRIIIISTTLGFFGIFWDGMWKTLSTMLNQENLSCGYRRHFLLTTSQDFPFSKNCAPPPSKFPGVSLRSSAGNTWLCPLNHCQLGMHNDSSWANSGLWIKHLRLGAGSYFTLVPAIMRQGSKTLAVEVPKVQVSYFLEFSRLIVNLSLRFYEIF